MRLDSLKASRLGWAVGLLTAAAALATAPAEAATVTCGQQVTASIVVDNDLTNCPGEGLVIAADDITVNLNGHTIDGPGATFQFRTRGIDLGSHSGVTVKNGTVTGFDLGVLGSFPGSHDSVILMTLTDDYVGAAVANDSTIAFDRIQAQQLAIELDGSRNEVAFDVITGGFVAVIGANNRVEHDQALSVIGAVGSADAYVADNTVNTISLEATSRWAIERNVVLGGGIVVPGSNTLIWRNRVIGSGIVVESSGLPSAPAATGNVLLGNTVGRAPGDGIFVAGASCPGGGSTCRPAAVNTLVRHNTARYNGDDGIDVEAPSTTIVRNITRYNTDLGIETVPGVIDGGRNRAFGNGNPAQCTGVVCSG